MPACIYGALRANNLNIWDDTVDYRYIATPVGDLLIAGDGAGLRYVAFPEGKHKIEPGANWQLNDAAFGDVKTQLDEYFAGKRRRFKLKLAPHGTPFQLTVLEALQAIPYGETRSYGDIAAGIGNPRAVRAVGAANGRNPISIIIPCHRVIGADGSLTGFGGGLDTKRFLLDLEYGEQMQLEV